MLNNALFTFFVLISLAFPLSAKKPEEWDGIHFIERRLNYVESPELSLIPGFEQENEVRKILKHFNPSGTVELLYRMPLPVYQGDDMMLHILNRISRISTMEGIEYYSGSRKSMYPYLEKAAVVEDKKSETPIADLQFDSLPSKPGEFIIYQRDTTFGDTWYDVEMEYTGSAIRLSMTNTTTMWYKVFPVLRKDRLHIEMIIVPLKDELLFYGLAAFKLGNTFGFEIPLDESFDHRMSALQVWFYNQVY